MQTSEVAKGKKLEKMVTQRLKFNLFETLIMPFYGWLCGFCFAKWKKKRHFLNKGVRKYSRETDIVHILGRLRQCHDSLKLILDQD